jgi:xanthine dehydrogenase small subunit
MGGNVANGSPIGDSMPPLIALGTTIVLNRGGARREIALEDFYLGYRQKDLQPGEFVERVRVPLAPADRVVGVYKVSKRPDQDISAVCAGFALRLVDGRATEFRAGFGGMAAVPARARACEAAIEGRPWTLETVTAGVAALAGDFQPLTDMRASADYRARIARNLLMKFYLETTGQPTGLDAVAEASHG